MYSEIDVIVIANSEDKEIRMMTVILRYLLSVEEGTNNEEEEDGKATKRENSETGVGAGWTNSLVVRRRRFSSGTTPELGGKSGDSSDTSL